MLTRHRRELSVAIAIAALAAVLVVAAPGYFSRENLIDLFLANMPVLIVALGMTLVIVAGEIDISVGSVFAVCGVVAGTLVKWGVPLPVAGLAACLPGGLFGAIDGSLVACGGSTPSVVSRVSVVVG